MYIDIQRYIDTYVDRYIGMFVAHSSLLTLAGQLQDVETITIALKSCSLDVNQNSEKRDVVNIKMHPKLDNYLL